MNAVWWVDSQNLVGFFVFQCSQKRKREKERERERERERKREREN
jgi:hypothetical protein